MNFLFVYLYFRLRLYPCFVYLFTLTFASSTFMFILYFLMILAHLSILLGCNINLRVKFLTLVIFGAVWAKLNTIAKIHSNIQAKHEASAKRVLPGQDVEFYERRNVRNYSNKTVCNYSKWSIDSKITFKYRICFNYVKLIKILRFVP